MIGSRSIWQTSVVAVLACAQFGCYARIKKHQSEPGEAATTVATDMAETKVEPESDQENADPKIEDEVPAAPEVSLADLHPPLNLSNNRDLKLTFEDCQNATVIIEVLGLADSRVEKPCTMGTALAGTAGSVTYTLPEGVTGQREIGVRLKSSSGKEGPQITLAVIYRPVDPEVVVFGQRDDYETATYGSLLSGDTFSQPVALNKVDGRFVVSDYLNKRVLIYQGEPGKSPYIQLGGFREPTERASASVMGRPGQIATDGKKLILSDAENGRILIWNTLPTKSLTPADVVVGQEDMNGYGLNQGGIADAYTLSGPLGVTTVGKRLAIADWTNSRILIYHDIPTANGQSANLVLGQTDFQATGYRDGSGNARDVSNPIMLGSDGTKLAVSLWSPRVHIWNAITDATPNYAPADVVVGAPDFVTYLPNNPPSAGVFGRPLETMFAKGKLYAADWYHGRLLYWDSLPSSGSAGNPNGVVGQSDFTTAPTERPATAKNSMYGPFALHYDEVSDKTYVVQRSSNQIAVYAGLPVTGDVAESIIGQEVGDADSSVNRDHGDKVGFSNGAQGLAVTATRIIAADFYAGRVVIYDRAHPTSMPIAAVGQPDLKRICWEVAADTCPALSATTIKGPMAVAVDGSNRLYVADTAANRILVYNQLPTTSGAVADFVLGQPSFTTSTANNGAAADKWLNQPQGMHVDGSTLYVADTGNNRILTFALPITQNQPTAAKVLGQPDMSTITAGTTATKMSAPKAVYVDASKVYVSDGGNARILIYDGIPASSAAADRVLGQVNFTSSTTGKSVTQFGGAPDAMTVDDGKLVVGDQANYRILTFSLPSTDGSAATHSMKGRFHPLNLASTTGDDWLFVSDEGHSGTNRIVGMKRAKFRTLLEPTPP